MNNSRAQLEQPDISPRLEYQTTNLKTDFDQSIS